MTGDPPPVELLEPPFDLIVEPMIGRSRFQCACGEHWVYALSASILMHHCRLYDGFVYSDGRLLSPDFEALLAARRRFGQPELPTPAAALTSTEAETNRPALTLVGAA